MPDAGNIFFTMPLPLPLAPFPSTRRSPGFLYACRPWRGRDASKIFCDARMRIGRLHRRACACFLRSTKKQRILAAIKPPPPPPLSHCGRYDVSRRYAFVRKSRVKQEYPRGVWSSRISRVTCESLHADWREKITRRVVSSFRNAVASVGIKESDNSVREQFCENGLQRERSENRSLEQIISARAR